MRLATVLVPLGLVGSSLATSESWTASTSCQAVTETVTVTLCQSETPLASAVESASVSSYSTVTSFSTLTSYVTVTPSQTIAGPVSSVVDLLPSSSGYYFIDHDGTTSWIGGVSPTDSFSSFITKTIELTVFPVNDLTVTQTTVVTVTPPAVTSVQPQSSALAEQSEDGTTTSTVTSYLIKSVISIQTVYLSSKSSRTELSAPVTSDSAVASAELTFQSTHTVTGPPTSITITVEEATTSRLSESACAITYVDVTTDLTYTVLATPSAGFASPMNSVGNFSSLISAASSWNTTLCSSPALTGSVHRPSGSSSAIIISSMSVGAVSQKHASAISEIVPSSDYRHGKNSSSALSSPTGYIPFMPGPTIFLSSPALFSRTSSTLTKMYTNTSTSAMPSPTVCGEHGDFTLTWEDEPNFLPSEPITSPSEAPPVFNPYHHMYFSDGFVYVPPPSVQFKPVSSPRLVMFVANETDDDNNSGRGQLSGEIGAGIRRSSSAFWFNAYSAYLGCDNKSGHRCALQITGLVYQNDTKSEVAAFHQAVEILPCLLSEDCQLTQVHFAESMKGLSGLRIQASAGGEAVSWFMDNLALGWTNNTCAAGLLRGSSR